MKAITFHGQHSLRLEVRPAPQLQAADDVVVRIAATGVCGTDRNIYLGNFPARAGVILGHESVGVVESIGAAVHHLRVGDRVVINPTLFCGSCESCQRGQFNYCENKTGNEIGVDRDGTFAEFVVLPERFLHRIPEGMSNDLAVFIEPLACVLNNAKAVDLQAEDDVVVLGAGPIGMVFAQFAQRVALRVTMVEKDRFRLAFARTQLDRVVDADDGPLLEAVLGHNHGRKPRVVIDTTGVMLEDSVALAAKGGRIAVMGFNAHQRPQVPVLKLVNEGIRIVGAGDYNAPIFPAAIDLAAVLPLDTLISHRFTLAEHERAFTLLAGAASDSGDYGAMKVLIESN